MTESLMEYIDKGIEIQRERNNHEGVIVAEAIKYQLEQTIKEIEALPKRTPMGFNSPSLVELKRVLEILKGEGV